ncbi:putative host killing protein [Salmonella enterica subsp. enterica serovar Paratyphi B str. SARA62]|uniref:KilA-N domain-containing protein n=1 Tax=Salmonella enterica TaxID=28901 RepID=A0A754DFJ9_SALER|nr:KilA-N domain-containing protein [Salmonella enterica]ESE73099.1 putative host killing protein [Salmonella enterica subsp. enterica serovar Paratyphi B str. SARA62]ESF86679.1 putative host killing protein [Salmonella enterica subsp. enterica serovar Paratyphi B str. ATCC BAA-1585]QUZ43927.1 KilA-N domain-containing protein [Salmonella enterica subsp. enterica serovar Paratyphi B str. CFSAN000549]HAF8516613.1 KilA-N domain-containing protein [Salmonella enterica]
MLLYLRNQDVTDLIEKYSSADISAVKTINGGTARGTYAIEPLVYAYASYLSNEFYKEVVDIRLDSEGRINMNDIHDAASIGRDANWKARKAPAKYLRSNKAKTLINNVKSSSGQICPVETKEGGNGGGTYAMLDILLAYAAWIDAEFYVTVAKTFGNVARGDVEAAEQETIVASCSSIRFRK